MTISQYIELLATEFLGHSASECHYSDATVFSTKVPRTMKYPCVGLDVDGWKMTGQTGNAGMAMVMNLYFVSHVKDTGSWEALNTAFTENFRNALLFLKQIQDDKEHLLDPAIYFDLLESTGDRIEFKDAALYGYVVSIVVTLPFEYLACQAMAEFNAG